MKRIIISSFALFFCVLSVFAQQRQERKVGSFTSVKAGGSFDVFLKKGAQEKVVIEAQEGPIDKIITEVSGGTLKIYIENDNWKNYHFRNVNIYVTFQQLEEIHGSGSGSLKLESPLSSPRLYLASSGSGSFYCQENMESAGDVKISNSGSGGFKIGSSVSAKGNIDIHNSGSGGVSIERLYANDLDVHNSGSGGMKINGGTTREQSVGLSGSGSFYAENLESNVCRIQKSGSGSVHVNVKDELKGNSSGSGNIYIKGTTARLDFHTSGSGKIKSID